jgi:hypothetical protein
VNLLELFAVLQYWAPRVLLAGLVLVAVGGVVIVRHRRQQRHVSGRTPAVYVPGVARAADRLPSSDEDLLDVAYVTDVVADR